nr:MAG TPA: hypothetical protein [Caudoviricetes sp.]
MWPNASTLSENKQLSISNTFILTKFQIRLLINDYPEKL